MMEIAMISNIILVFTFTLHLYGPCWQNGLALISFLKSVSSYVKVHFVMAVSYILQYHNKR
jgi:hypothetical protein